MTHRPIFVTLTLILITLSFGAQTLSADTTPLTFASFSQPASVKGFGLVNNLKNGKNASVSFSAGAALDTPGTKIVFNVDPLAPTTGYGAGMAGTSIDAYLWLTSTTGTPATVFGPTLIQPFDQTFLHIQSIADFTKGNANYLLTATYQGYMVGTVGSHSTAEFNSLDVTYTSYYLNLPGAENGELHLNFDNLTPAYTTAKNGLVDNFTTAGGGSFTASFAPEPQTYALFATCFAVLGWKIRHNRRTSKQNEARLQNDKR